MRRRRESSDGGVGDPARGRQPDRQSRREAEKFFEEDPVRIPVTDVFDLHSVPDRDLRAVVEEYLREAQALGLRYVRLIHGRGLGVRREIVRSILSQTEFVASYGDAPLEAGGWGATVAVLRPAGQPG